MRTAVKEKGGLAASMVTGEDGRELKRAPALASVRDFPGCTGTDFFARKAAVNVNSVAQHGCDNERSDYESDNVSESQN
jgi:hypothetical protein